MAAVFIFGMMLLNIHNHTQAVQPLKEVDI